VRSPALPLFLLFTGCASLPSAPFRSFHASVEKAQAGLETEMGRDVDWTREAEIQEVADRKDAVLSGYMVKEAEGFRWSMETRPAYWTTRLSRRALRELNAAFTGYAGLLADVASGEKLDAADVDALASGLNRSLREVSGLLDGLTKAAPGPIAGVSAVVAEAFHRFLRHRRARDLKAAITGNQSWVEHYAASCLSLIGIIRADLKASYADQMESLQKRWDDKRSPGRATLTRSLFNLNEDYVDAMEALEALTSFYAALPAAHKDLALALDRTARGRPGLTALAGSAGRVARRTRDLEKVK
jgi:hypothetical protein